MTRQYVLCLILTDGDINDVETTQELLKQGQDLPLSVMVVRVGAELKHKQDGGADGKIAAQDKLELIRARQRYSHAGQLDPKDKGRDIFRYLNYSSLKLNQEDFPKKVFKLLPKQVGYADTVPGVHERQRPGAQEDR